MTNQRIVTRAQLRIARDRASLLLRTYRNVDPWALADDLREALFLLGEEATPDERELLRDYGGV